MAVFCAAALAFGRVASVLQSIESLLRVMGPTPAAFVRSFDAARDRAPLEPLVHRWIRGRDLVALMLILQRMVTESGSIEGFFRVGDDPSLPDVSAALDGIRHQRRDVDIQPRDHPGCFRRLVREQLQERIERVAGLVPLNRTK